MSLAGAGSGEAKATSWPRARSSAAIGSRREGSPRSSDRSATKRIRMASSPCPPIPSLPFPATRAEPWGRAGHGSRSPCRASSSPRLQRHPRWPAGRQGRLRHRVEHRGKQLRAGRAPDRVHRHESIARDEHTPLGQMEGPVPAGVTGSRDRHQVPRHIQRDRSRFKELHLGEPLYAQPALTHYPQCPQQHARPSRGTQDLHSGDLLDDLPFGMRGRGVQQPDRDATVGTQPLSRADMVGMGMGKHHSSHIPKRPPDPLQGGAPAESRAETRRPPVLPCLRRRPGPS